MLIFKQSKKHMDHKMWKNPVHYTYVNTKLKTVLAVPIIHQYKTYSL